MLGWLKPTTLVLPQWPILTPEGGPYFFGFADRGRNMKHYGYDGRYLGPANYAWLKLLTHGPQRYVLARPSLETLLKLGLVTKTEQNTIILTPEGWKEYHKRVAYNATKTRNKRLKEEPKK